MLAMNKNTITLAKKMKRTIEREGCPESHQSGVRKSHWWLVGNVPSEFSITQSDNYIMRLILF